MATVTICRDFEPKEIKFVTAHIVSSSICNEVMGSDAMIIALNFFLFKFIYFNWRLITLQYCIGFAIHQHEFATGVAFWMLSFKPAFWLCSFTFIKRLFSSSSLSAIRVVSSGYLRLLIFLPEILIPTCASSSLAFHMMVNKKLNKQGDNIQPWQTPFPNWQVDSLPLNHQWN